MEKIELQLVDLLSNKTLLAIHVSPGANMLTFTLDDGELVTLQAYGSCCSKTWFQEVLGFSKYIPQGLVFDVIDLKLPDPGYKEDSWVFLQDYGFQIRTQLGVVTVVYRNSSNGYYGGWYEIEGPVIPGEEWISVQGDWSL